jgi:hypothetical protein
MNKNLSKLFKQAYDYPESRLSDNIWRVIEIKHARNLKIQSLFYSFVGILSLGSLVLVIISLNKQFSSSGFFQYASLVFSDGSLLALYWKEYLLSLTDSIPFATMGVAIFLMFSTLISIKKVARQYKNLLLTIN